MANLSEVELNAANLRAADLWRANLRAAKLAGVNFRDAYLREANLTDANLTGADLTGANLGGENLSGANLQGATLLSASLVSADLTGANLTGCLIHGVSAWRVKLDAGTKQQNLIITHQDEPSITVDNIEVAQFTYLMLHNEKIRNVIDTITSKAVLILGRFQDERKVVLEALREELRHRKYLPILYDVDRPATRDMTETLSLLARMARFVLVDITDARAVPQELSVIVPHLPSVPVQPLVIKGACEYGMFEHYARFPWVLPIYRYETREQLVAALAEVIDPADRLAQQFRSGASAAQAL